MATEHNTTDLNTDEQVAVSDTARDLSATEQQVLSELQTEFESVEEQGATFHRSRALNFRGQHLFVKSVGRANLETHGETVLHWETKSRSLVYSFAASIVTNVNPYGTTDPEERKERQNRIAPVAKMLAALPHFADEHETLNDEEFVAWYNKKGRFDGIWSKYQEATKAAPKARGGDEEGKVNDIIAAMLENPAVFELKQGLGRTAGGVTIFVAQSEGDATRLLPLNVTPAFIASLAGNVPNPMDEAPTDLMFWRQMLTVGETIIPDSMSNQPAVAMAPDDEPNASTPMLPSYAMFLVRDGKVSIASARDKDTLVVEVEPLKEVAAVLMGALLRDGFLNNRTRRLASPRLIAPTTCAGYIPTKPGDAATKITGEGEKVTIAFKHRNKRENTNLIVTPRKDMGSVWTYRVSPDFSPAVSCKMAQVAGAFETETLKPISKARKDHSVTVAIGEEDVSFAYGKAAAQKYAGQTSGSASAKVDRGDFLRALSGLMAQEDVMHLSWTIDPRGLLAVEATTQTATYRVFMQTLREDGVRHRALLDLVTAN